MYFLLKGFAEKVQLMENIARWNIPAICHCYVCFEVRLTRMKHLPLYYHIYQPPENSSSNRFN